MAFNTSKIFALIRQGALVAPAAAYAAEPTDMQTKLTNILRVYTGYDIAQKNFRPERLIQGWGAYAGAKVATQVLPRLINMFKDMV